MSSYYVVLPSSTICDYRRNKQNDFITTLPRPIQGQNLTVRLTSITFKKSWPDIHENNNTFYLCAIPEVVFAGEYVEPVKKSIRFDENELTCDMSDGTSFTAPLHKYEIGAGYYTTPEQVVQSIGEKCEGLIDIRVEYAPKRIYVTVPPGLILILPKNGLASVLGIREDSDVLTPGRYISKYPAFSLSRIHYFHVVLEGLTRPIICGNGRRAILETIPGDGEPEQVLEYHFKNNPFHKVLRQHFNTIRVQILDNNFNPLPIITGETILTLEFQDEDR